MLDLLPTRAADVSFSRASVIDDSFPSGHALDDVYAALDKTRRDGVAATRLSPATGDELGAVRVDGVPGDQLLDAFVSNWRSAAILARTNEAIGDRSVWVLAHRGGATTVAYQLTDVVLYAYSEAGDQARQFVMALP